MTCPIQQTLERMNDPTNSTLVGFLISAVLESWPHYEDDLACALETIDLDEAETGRVVFSALRRVQSFLSMRGGGGDDEIDFFPKLAHLVDLSELSKIMAEAPLVATQSSQIKFDIERLTGRLLQGGFDPELVVHGQIGGQHILRPEFEKLSPSRAERN